MNEIIINHYDALYKDDPDTFGEHADLLLVRSMHLVDEKYPVLDIGAGTGRNAIPLARQGHRVTALEPSEQGRDVLKKKSADQQLDISIVGQSFLEYQPAELPFSAILVFGLLPILERGQIDELKSKIDSWLVEGGFVFLSGFTVNDPSYNNCKTNGRQTDRNSFVLADGQVRTYFEQNEVPALFPEFDTVYHRENFGSQHRHADGPEHCHHQFKTLLQKKK